MTAGSRSSPAITSAGSPGNRCWSEKIRIDTKNSVGTICRRRLPRKFSMVFCLLRKGKGGRKARRAASGRRLPELLSLQLQSDDADQSILHLPIAFELLGMREQELLVIEVDDRLVVQHDLGQFFVDRFAGGGIAGQP